MAGKRASEIFSIILVGTALYGVHSYYASAADVDKKYERLDSKVDVGLSELRKAMIADQLVRLRTGKKDPSTDAQIKHYESELQNVNDKLRDLDRKRK